MLRDLDFGVSAAVVFDAVFVCDIDRGIGQSRLPIVWIDKLFGNRLGRLRAGAQINIVFIFSFHDVLL